MPFLSPPPSPEFVDVVSVGNRAEEEDVALVGNNADWAGDVVGEKDVKELMAMNCGLTEA